MRTASDAITAPSAYRAATVRERSANAIATIESITQPEQIPFT